MESSSWMKKPKLLDLFCGAGGCSMGYHQSGFNITGVDNLPQKRYPFNFILDDAMEYLINHGQEYDVIHASPPCQLFSVATKNCDRKKHNDLITPIRKVLIEIGKPYIIENVPGASIKPNVVLCGLMFGLKVFRHRHFDCSFFIFTLCHPPHTGKHIGDGYYSVAGHSGRWKSRGKVHRNIGKGTVAEWRDAMGIDWMTRKELAQAIPPAYTQFIGDQLINIIK